MFETCSNTQAWIIKQKLSISLSDFDVDYDTLDRSDFIYFSFRWEDTLRYSSCYHTGNDNVHTCIIFRTLKLQTWFFFFHGYVRDLSTSLLFLTRIYERKFDKNEMMLYKNLLGEWLETIKYIFNLILEILFFFYTIQLSPWTIPFFDINIILIVSNSF